VNAEGAPAAIAGTASGRAASPVAVLRDPRTIRARSDRLFEMLSAGELAHFRLNPDRFEQLAEALARVTLERYPDLDVPYHSRWRHFAARGVDRWRPLAERLAGDSAGGSMESARSAIDLAVVSVLLDAGAGADWRYVEPAGGLELSRSEGLAVASLHMFAGGAFSSDPDRQPLRVDARALQELDEAGLAAGFQVGASNPLAGLEGRAALMTRLGRQLEARPDMFGADPARPGRLLDFLGAGSGRVEARDILGALLDGLETIWPGRESLEGHNLGDVWRHSRLDGYDDATDGLMPFHKLTQWLAYSLVEPLEWAGIAVAGLDELTPLAEYRNGGLLVDSGLLVPRAETARTRSHRPDSELVVEWRALTIALIERLADPVRERLGRSAMEFPLAKLLEGGSWAAGRRLAFERDLQGRPPIEIISDGTVF